jgi:hypothetical protein
MGKRYEYLFPWGTIGQIQRTVDDLARKGWRMVGGLTFTGPSFEPGESTGESFFFCTMEKEVEEA